jgi:dipeptidyl aminopeptidase/acylaminoacyl peptidase
VLLVAVGIAPSARCAEKTPLQLGDLYRGDQVTYLTLAPDAQSAVYCRQWIDPDKRAYRYSLWRVEGQAENRRPLEESEPDARRPMLSPDGKWVLFLSTRPFPDGTPAFAPVPPYSDPATDIWLIPLAGGKAIPLGGKQKPYGRVFSDRFYGHIAFSPDGKRLVFVADERGGRRTREEIEAGVIVVREDQGEGYTGYGPAQIWIAKLADEPNDVGAERITRVTHDEFWYGDPEWLPDGSCVVVHANRTADRESVRYSINKNYDLWRIDVDDHELHQLTTGIGPEVSPRIAPDGQRLVCLSVPRKGPHADVYNVLLVDLVSPEPKSEILYDHHALTDDEPPHRSPSFPLPRDCWLDEHRFVSHALVGLGTRRQVIDLARGPEAMDYLPADDEHHRRVAEARRRLTPPSVTPMRDRLRAPDRTVRWKSFDGLEIEGVLTVPPEEITGPPYKLIVHPHGGPHHRASSGSSFAVQLFAANGYAVFQPNFRGSTGYGRAFLDADRFDFGGGDMRDILTGIDYLVAEGIVDPKRQFVYGVSYGGYMTSWLVGHTHQFCAAVAQNAVTDLNAMWHLSDLQSWTQWEFGGLPWEVPEAMHRHSPLSYASQVRTPTLILHAANDRRCPLAMGTMFCRALREHGVETQMVIYPDEGHPIKQLPHRYDVLRRVLDWFDQYDSPPTAKH